MENPKAPRLSEIKEPQVAALVGVGRTGTKFLQSYLDNHQNVLMVPGYPLMYLYPHFDDWCKQFSESLSWERIIGLFCEKHASVLDSRKVRGLSGLERLGPERNEHIEIDEPMFREYLRAILDGFPVRRRSFLLAVHYAYGLCKKWDLKSKTVLFYHIHCPGSLPELVEDFPDLKLIYMVRDSGATLHSMIRMLGVVDRAKLNMTDSLRLLGRTFWLSCSYQFDTFDCLKDYLDEKQARTVRLDDLCGLEYTMRNLAGWLEIDFNETMLKSTFDGKLWWGDAATVKSANGFNNDALSDKWKKSISKFDLFVIEGVSFHFFEKYKYKRIMYKHDTFINRILLFLAILAPTKIEWKIMGIYLDPRTHLRFIAAAFNESREKVPRKDYTWNATYLYKWTYKSLELWRARWHERFLDFTDKRFKQNHSPRYVPAVACISRILYVVVQYARFWAAILMFPVYIFKRWCIYYRSFWKRINKRVFLPRLLNNPAGIK